MEMTLSQKLDFARNGYIVLRQAVPQMMIDRALRAINHSLGQEGMNKDDLPTLRAQSYCREITQTPPITDLVNATPIRPIVESVLADGGLAPNGSGQVALRFPGMGDPATAKIGVHLDGMYSPLNGVQKGKLNNFTALAVVLLSDLPEPWMGNFTVVPGSHRIYEKYFQTHGPESLFDGMPDVETAEPVQMTGKAGDVVITHYQVAHTAAPNLSSHIRYAAIYRLNHVDHKDHLRDVMTDIWREWPGIREVVDEHEPAAV